MASVKVPTSRETIILSGLVSLPTGGTIAVVAAAVTFTVFEPKATVVVDAAVKLSVPVVEVPGIVSGVCVTPAGSPEVVTVTLPVNGAVRTIATGTVAVFPLSMTKALGSGLREIDPVGGGGGT